MSLLKRQLILASLCHLGYNSFGQMWLSPTHKVVLTKRHPKSASFSLLIAKGSETRQCRWKAVHLQVPKVGQRNLTLRPYAQIASDLKDPVPWRWTENLCILIQNEWQEGQLGVWVTAARAGRQPLHMSQEKDQQARGLCWSLDGLCSGQKSWRGCSGCLFNGSTEKIERTLFCPNNPVRCNMGMLHCD